jgi:hypothetical protein
MCVFSENNQGMKQIHSSYYCFMKVFLITVFYCPDYSLTDIHGLGLPFGSTYVLLV